MSKSIKLNIIFKTLMNVVNIIFPLLTAPYVARILSVDGFTEYNRAQSIMTWVSPFAIFGVYTYGMRTMSQIRDNSSSVSKLFTQLFFFNVFTSSFVSIIFCLVVFFNSSFSEFRAEYLIFSFQIFCVCFATDWGNEAYEKYGFILIKTFVCRVLYVISVFVFVKDEDDLIIYMLLTTLSLFFNNLSTFFYSKKHIKFTKIEFKDELQLIKPLFIVFLLVNSSMLYTIFDKFILMMKGTKLDLTYYNISQIIVFSVMNVTSSAVLISIPRLSYLWKNDMKNEFDSVLKKTSDVFLAINTPCCFGIAAISFEIIYLYSGLSYLSAVPVLFLFAIRQYISGFDMILSKQVMLATGHESCLTKIYYIGGFYNIACKLLIFFTNKLSPELCVITTASADILIIILEKINIKKMNISIHVLSKEKVKYFICSLLFFPIAFFFKTQIPFVGIGSVIIRVLFTVIACSAFYFFVLYITKDSVLYNFQFFKKKVTK